MQKSQLVVLSSKDDVPATTPGISPSVDTNGQHPERTVSPPVMETTETTTTELLAVGRLSRTSHAHCKGDSFYSSKGGTYFPLKQGSHRANKTRIAVLFRGEAFRSKMKASADKRWANQLQASESHVKFLLSELRQAGVDIDVFAHGSVIGDVKVVDAESKLKELYGPWGRFSAQLTEKKFPSQGDGYMDAVKWFMKQAGAASAQALPYDFVFVLRFDIAFTSSAMPPMSEKSLAFTHVLFAMRDADFGWKTLGYVHDSMQWVPKLNFKAFFNTAAGRGGCYERSKHWYAGSGHGCHVVLNTRGVNQGFFHEGCFAVKDTHPFYSLTEMRRKR